MRRLAFLYLLAAYPAYAAGTLDRVKSTHHLRCGIIAEQSDFEWQDTHAGLARFATDMCRALSGAVLGGTAGLQIRGYPDSPHGLQALHDGALDVLYGVTPRAEWALHYGVAFAEPVFFDSQTVMVSATSGIATLGDLADKSVCFIGNTVIENRIRRAFAARNIALRPFPFQETGEMEAALVTGHCKAQTGDASALAAGRTGFHAQQKNFVILPDTLFLDPYAPALAADDTTWLRVIDAAQDTLIEAEEEGVTKANAVARAAAAEPGAFLQSDGSGAPYGLDDGWRATELAQAGDYGEIFDRDLGARSPLRLARGLNRWWSKGGLFWVAPRS